MRKKLAYGFCIFAVLLTFVSCVNDADEGACDSPQTMQIKFTIEMSGERSPAATRTEWGSVTPKETADLWENTIEEGKLQVLLYNADNNLMGEVQNLTYIRRAGDDNNIYDIVGDLTVDIIGESNETTLNGKLVVLANYDDKANATKGTSLYDIADNLYEYDVTGIKARTKYIPMFGVHSISNNLKLVKGERADAGDIRMLRAMAKVRVSLDSKTAEKYVLENVSLSDYNQKGYTNPTDFATVAETEKLDDEGSLHVKKSKAGTELPFTKISDGTWVVYVPESSATDPAHINVSITPQRTGISSTAYEVEIKNYGEGKATGGNLNIVRNTIYDYTISIDDDVKIQYRAMPWNDGSGTVIFGD